MFCKFPKRHNYIYHKVLKNVWLSDGAHECNGVKFPPQTAFEEPVCHSRWRINIVSLHSAEGQPLFTQEKRVFLGWTPVKDEIQILTTAEVHHTYDAAAGAWFPPNFTQTCLPETGNAGTCVVNAHKGDPLYHSTITITW